MIPGRPPIQSATQPLLQFLLTLLAVLVAAGHAAELAKFLGGSWTKGEVSYHNAYMTLLVSSGLMLLVAGLGNKNGWTLCLVAGAVTTMLSTVRLLLGPVPADFIVFTLASPAYVGPTLAFVAYIACVWFGNRALCRSRGEYVMLLAVIGFPLLVAAQIRFFLFGAGLSHVVILPDDESFVQTLALLVLIALAALRDVVQLKVAIRRRSPAEQADNC